MTIEVQLNRLIHELEQLRVSVNNLNTRIAWLENPTYGPARITPAKQAEPVFWGQSYKITPKS